jgi:hypothetical protein
VIVAWLVKKFYVFMDPNGSSPRSQKLIIGHLYLAGLINFTSSHPISPRSILIFSSSVAIYHKI